jgi:L-ascorbate metabolism protein UlaG (beta-lactamase superfamily)
MLSSIYVEIVNNAPRFEKFFARFSPRRSCGIIDRKGGLPMRVTYIDHSSFLVEFSSCAFLFDWFRGEVPPVAADKRLFVLASHAHPDHYSADIFAQYADRAGTEFVLSRDIKKIPRVAASITRLAAHESAVFDDVRIETLGSTDTGVSFLIEVEGKRIFHMGDLNWWDWGAEDTPEDAAKMEHDYRVELARLVKRPLDLAFVPLDPRLGDGFWKGIDALMRTVPVRHAIPMHCWGDPEIAARLCALDCAAPYRDRIIALTASGQTVTLED